MPAPTRSTSTALLVRAFVTCAAFASLSAAVALSVPERARAQGFLLPTAPDAPPLAIEHHRVAVSIRERVAETRIDQVFTNQTGTALEASYVFPLPPGASVSGFAMWVGGRRVPGEVLEAVRARRIYEGIVARVRDPGLVEFVGGRLFRARVSAVPAGGSQRIELRFTQTLSYHAGVVHYRYPLRTAGAAPRTRSDMTVSARIVSRTPIRAVYSPSHPVEVSRPDDHHAVVGFEANGVVLDDDFDLYYAVQDRDVGLSLLTHRPGGPNEEDGYFVAMISPRIEAADREIANKEIIFVFDTSGSMAGEKLERAKAALDYMLARLRPGDHFQIVRFATDVEALFGGTASVPASRANIDRARRFASRFVAAGGTALDGGLGAAYATRSPGGLRAPRMVVFLTDGMPTIGQTDPRAIIDRVGASAETARLFVFGVGDDVNTTFLDQLASRGRGVGDYFRDGREMEGRLSAFYDRVAYPLITDIALEFPGLDVADVYPRDLGHLYRGGQLFVVGRYRGAGVKAIRLVGQASHDDRPRVFSYQAEFPEQRSSNDWLPRLWATRKVGHLLDEIRLRGERRGLREEVQRVAQRFGIVTPYTNYLAVADDEMPPGLAAAAPPSDGSESIDSPAPVSPVSSAPRPAFEGFAEATSDYDYAEAETAAGGSSGGARRGAPAGGAGERGRAISRRLRAMREAERAPAGSPSMSSGNTRYVAGRTFRLIRGMWVDVAYRRDMPTLRIRYASPAYFALLRARPAVARFLVLGERLTLVAPGRRAVVVDPSASAGVSATEVRRFITGGTE
ncbi:MAG: VWA domain-containing protein [Deltaproteobacteria bacterium]|nr:VWA domain-containing protein [Deltaproteobacteria bacterium]